VREQPEAPDRNTDRCRAGWRPDLHGAREEGAGPCAYAGTLAVAVASRRGRAGRVVCCARCFGEAGRVRQSIRIRKARGIRTAEAGCIRARFRQAGCIGASRAEAVCIRARARCITQEVMRSIFLCLVVALAGCRENKAPAPTTASSSAPAKAELLKVGDTAPSTPKLDLAAHKGKHVVVYFYPKDDTPGCTKEACAFRDAWSKLEKAQVQIIGVSVDNEESHKAFVEKYKLPFPLVADTDQSICKAYGVNVTMGYASRVSFLIGPDGKIKKVYPKVDPAVHADEILADAGGAA
jgi:thioredoxin-dependent peroxiredoxin